MPVGSSAGDRAVSGLEYRKGAVKKWNLSTLAKCSSDREGWGKIKMDPYPYFIVCVQCSDLDEVKRILKSGFDVNTQGEDGITGLHEACFHDDLDMAKFLLDNKAKVNLADNSGFTPLHSAANSSLEMLELLIEYGADPLISNYKGVLPVEMCEEKDGELVQYLEKIMEEKETAGQEAADDEEHSHFLKDVKNWIVKGDVNKIRGPNGDTPLHLAASKGYSDIAELLVKAKINLEAKDNDGWTALHCAVYWGELEVVKLLVDSGADIYALETYGHTPFDFVDLLIKRINAGQYFYPEDMKIQTEIKKFFDSKTRYKTVDLSTLGPLFVPKSSPSITPKSILSAKSTSSSSTISRPPGISRPPSVATPAPSPSPSTSPIPSPSGVRMPPSTLSSSSLKSSTLTPPISSPRIPAEKPSISTPSTISRPPTTTTSAIRTPPRSSVDTPSSVTSVKVPPSSPSISRPPTVPSTTTKSYSSTTANSDASMSTASLSEVMSLRKEIEALKEKLASKDKIIESLRRELDCIRER